MSATFAQDIQQLIDERDRLTDEAVARVLFLLEELHQQVLARIAAQPDPSSTMLLGLRRELEQLISQFESQLASSVSGYQVRSWDLADTAVSAQMAATSVHVGIVGVSTETLTIMQGYSATLIRGLTEEALRRINTEIQLASLGGRSFEDLVRNIGRNLDDPSIFGTIRARAETIARTEVGRAYELGSRVRGNQVAQTLPGLRKRWLHATGMMPPGKLPKGMYQPRASHVALHKVTIPWDAKFNVGGYEADGPMDPSLPARESINCKCTTVLDFSALEDTSLRM